MDRQTTSQYKPILNASIKNDRQNIVAHQIGSSIPEESHPGNRPKLIQDNHMADPVLVCSQVVRQEDASIRAGEDCLSHPEEGALVDEHLDLDGLYENDLECIAQSSISNVHVHENNWYSTKVSH